MNKIGLVTKVKDETVDAYALLKDKSKSIIKRL